MKFKKTIVSALASLMLLPSTGINAKKQTNENLTNLPKTEKTQEKNRWSIKDQPIHRNQISVDVNSSKVTINNKKYEEGVSLNLNFKKDIDLNNWLNLRTILDLNYQNLVILTEDANEQILKKTIDLEGRIKFYGSKDLKSFISIGLNSDIEDQRISYKSLDGNLTRYGLGPLIGLSLESKYIDATLLGNIFFGEYKSSFDRNKQIFGQRIRLNVIPRYWIFEMPLNFEYKSWAIRESQVDRQENDIKLNIQPTAKNLIPHTAIFLNITYNKRFGSDDYDNLELGGGLKIQW